MSEHTDFIHDDYVFKSGKGLNRDVIMRMCEQKNEPGWMIDFRLKALSVFELLPVPTWGADLGDLDLYDIFYYIRPLDELHTTWDTVPEKIKNTFQKLGIPQAEQQFLAGVGAQFESELIYKSLKKNGQTRVLYLWI